jgi:hypothetical protein
MVIIFNETQTSFVKGSYSAENTLNIVDGNLDERYQNALKNSFRVLLQQESRDFDLIQMSLGTNINIITIMDRSSVQEIKFLIIVNPIFINQESLVFVASKLRLLLAEFQEDIFDKPLNYLQKTENEVLKELPAVFTEKLPLILNLLLSSIEKQGYQKESIEFYNSFSTTKKSLLDPLNMLKEVSEITEENNNLLENLASLLAEADNEERGRFWYNLAITANRMGKQFTFQTILSKYLLSRTDYVKDYSLIYAASKTFIENTQLALEYISSVNEDNLRALSIKSLIGFYRLKGAIFEKQGSYSESIKEYMQAVSLLENLQTLTPDVALAYAGIGNIRSLIGQHTKAITAYSFAASLFEFLSLEKQKISMLNNILTIRKLKSKNFLSAGVLNLNNEKYSDADEFLEIAVQEYSLLLLEAQHDKLLDICKEILSMFRPIFLRAKIELELEQNISLAFSKIRTLLNISKKILEGEKKEEVFEELTILSKPRQTVVYQAILIYQDGRFITSVSTDSERVAKDKDMIFAGAMTAIQMLLKELIHSEKIHTIDAGETQIILRKGTLVQVVVIANTISEQLTIATDQLIQNIEGEYKEILEDWDGSLVELRKTNALIQEFIFNAANE